MDHRDGVTPAADPQGILSCNSDDVGRVRAEARERVRAVGGGEEEGGLIVHIEVVLEHRQTTEAGWWLPGNSDPRQAEWSDGYHKWSTGL